MPSIPLIELFLRVKIWQTSEKQTNKTNQLLFKRKELQVSFPDFISRSIPLKEV